MDHSGGPITPACYDGAIDLKVCYADGSPAADVPIGLGIVVWQPDADSGRFHLHHKTPQTNRDGGYHRDRWRECMTPTWIFAADEARRLAALLPLDDFDQIDGPHVLTLHTACWVRGRAVSSVGTGSTVTSTAQELISMYPSWNPHPRPLKCVCADDGSFQFLVPPGKYTLHRSDRLSESAGIRIEVPPDIPALDLGALRFPMNEVNEAQPQGNSDSVRQRD